MYSTAPSALGGGGPDTATSSTSPSTSPSASTSRGNEHEHQLDSESIEIQHENENQNQNQNENENIAPLLLGIGVASAAVAAVAAASAPAPAPASAPAPVPAVPNYIYNSDKTAHAAHNSFSRTMLSPTTTSTITRTTTTPSTAHAPLSRSHRPHSQPLAWLAVTGAQRPWLSVLTVLSIVYALATFRLLFWSVDAPTTVLVSLDGFRAAYLELDPVALPIPTLRELAATGMRAAHLTPVFPTMTFPNHQTLITGMLPRSHGIVANVFRDTKLMPGAMFNYTDKTTTRDPRWWNAGEPFWATVATLPRCNNSAVHSWPGSHAMRPRAGLHVSYKPHVPPTERVASVLRWLRRPAPPCFIALYLPDIDAAGHKYGPESPLTYDVIQSVDAALAPLLQAATEMELYGRRPNIIIVSDHGMTSVKATDPPPKPFSSSPSSSPSSSSSDSSSTTVILNSMKKRDPAAIEKSEAKAVETEKKTTVVVAAAEPNNETPPNDELPQPAPPAPPLRDPILDAVIYLNDMLPESLLASYDVVCDGGAVMFIDAKPPATPAAIVEELNARCKHCRAYTRENVPPALMYSGNDARIAQIILIADNNYIISTQVAPSPPTIPRGMHGYPVAQGADQDDMHAVFIGNGPFFSGSRRGNGVVVPPLDSTGVYSILCHVHGVEPAKYQSHALPSWALGDVDEMS